MTSVLFYRDGSVPRISLHVNGTEVIVRGGEADAYVEDVSS